MSICVHLWFKVFDSNEEVIAMQEIIQTSVARPLPRVDVAIRAGVLSDVPFLDALQKMHTKQVGWMPTKQFEGKINLGHVLIAEVGGEPVGYCIGNDQYFKRDDVGIIYQMNVSPGRQRGLIGATLLKSMFERSAYGCKLFCCWCAQDIAANRFWEAMGFVPLAFRAGSEKKSRVHIFWQKRIRSGDTTTPWWFPSQTSAGSIREDRLVFPIPPGTHWQDAKPIILPRDTHRDKEPLSLSDATTTRMTRTRNPETASAAKRQPLRGGLIFALPSPVKNEVPAEKPKKQPRKKLKNDPKYVAAARELRDRYMEQFNKNPPALPTGKYEVVRTVDESINVKIIEPMKLLAA